MTKTTGNFTDFVSFSRASGGTALRRISYGSELVTNGTFDTDTTGWTAYKGAGLSVVSGKLRVTNGVSGRGGAGQAIPTVVGKVYTLTLDGIPSPNSTQVFAYVGSALGGSSIAYLVNTNGTGLRLNFVAQGSETWITVLPADTTTGDYNDFDNISVKEVLFDRADGTLQLFNHPTNVPRVEYDASGNRKGLLIEEARTNLVPYSNNFTDASWSKTRSSISSGEELAPDGNTATKLVEDTSLASSHTLIYVYSSAPVATYTNSVFVKAAGRAYVRLAQTVTEVFSADFSLSDGSYTAAPSTTASSQYVGNGWYRLSITYTTTSIHSLAFVVYLTVGTSTTYNGDGTSGVYIYGAQLEAGAFPTSYIPTTGATATRAADICSIATSAFGYNQGAGTIVIDVAEFKFGTSGYPRAVELGNSSNGGERINIYVDSALQNYRTSLNTANALQANILLASGVVSPLAPSKATLTYKTNDVVAAYSGSVVGTDTLADIAGTSYPRNTLKIGGSTTAVTDQINGHIKSLSYFPRRLTNAQLQSLTG